MEVPLSITHLLKEIMERVTVQGRREGGCRGARSPGLSFDMGHQKWAVTAFSGRYSGRGEASLY